MARRPNLFSLAVAAGALALSTSAMAQIYINVEPPANRHEQVPSARNGYVWAAGHHEWRNGRYEWVPGRWERERRGYEWRQPRWVQRGNGSWHMLGGNWERQTSRGSSVAGPLDNPNDRNANGIPDHLEGRR